MSTTASPERKTCSNAGPHDEAFADTLSSTEQEVGRSKVHHLHLSLDTVPNDIAGQYTDAFLVPSHIDVRGWSPPDGSNSITLQPHEFLPPRYNTDPRMPAFTSQPLSDPPRVAAPVAERNEGYWPFGDLGSGGVQYELPPTNFYGIPSIYPDLNPGISAFNDQLPLYEAQGRLENAVEGSQSPFFQSSDFHPIQLRSSFLVDNAQPQSVGTPRRYDTNRPAPPRGGVAPALARSITNIRLARERATRLARDEARDFRRGSREKGTPSVLEGWLDPTAISKSQDPREDKGDHSMATYIMPGEPLSWEYV